MNKLVFSVAFGATIVSSPVGAQTAPSETRMPREISRQQAQQFADSMFDRFDLNHDGAVTRDEAQQASSRMDSASGHGGARAQRMIDKLFGTTPSVTKSQFETMALARFDKQDVNRDGLVTSAERQQARASRQSPQ